MRGLSPGFLSRAGPRGCGGDGQVWGRPRLWPRGGVSGGSRAAGSALDGVLDLGPGLLEVALGLVSAAFGAQAPAAGEPPGGLLEGAFDCLGLVCDLLGNTHGGLPFGSHSAGADALAEV